MMYLVFGAKLLGACNLTGLAYLYFFNRAYDCLLMPHHLEGLKIAERANIENKTFAKAVIVAIGVSIIATIGHICTSRIRMGSIQRGQAERPSVGSVGDLSNPLVPTPRC